MALRLADFIVRDMKGIVARWEDFARLQLPAAARMGSLALRDHAEEILGAVARDLRLPESRDEQAQKSMGLAPHPNAPETAAQTHALLRARSGFDVTQLAAEYRALRASVIQLWLDDCANEAPPLDDIIRFNEAIDQALAESIDFFNVRVERSRNLFLGMLGHDLRSPLQSIQMTAKYLSALNAGEDVSAAANRLIRSGGRMQALLDDLLDFNRTQLGLGIPIVLESVDLARLFGEALDDMRVAYPGHQILWQVAGDAVGAWDGPRMQQLLSNLVINAIKYGKSDSPVLVTMTGAADELSFEVTNSGATIDPIKLEGFFEACKRGQQDTSGEQSIGLGLYIAREIARAHRGDISGRSDRGETTFTVRLPRR